MTLSDAELEAWLKREVGLILDKPLACWDLDSTLARTLHRRYLVPFIKEGEATWHDYSMLCKDDEPIEGSVALMRELTGHSHLAISGRSSRALSMTWTWVRYHKVPLNGIVLRPDDTENGAFKVRIVNALKALGADIRLFFEDYDVAAAEIREQTGVPVVGINPFDPPEEERGSY